MLFLQNFFHKGKVMRDISVNSQYLVIFKSPRDRTQIRTLAAQMSHNSRFLSDSFEDATSEPYGYLLIDFRQETPDEFRVRSKIFNGESIVIYCDLNGIKGN